MRAARRFVITAVLSSVGALGAVLAHGTAVGSPYIQQQCVPDDGCFLNPFEPDKQYWTYTYQQFNYYGWYHSHQMSGYESGGCC